MPVKCTSSQRGWQVPFFSAFSRRALQTCLQLALTQSPRLRKNRSCSWDKETTIKRRKSLTPKCVKVSQDIGICFLTIFFESHLTGARNVLKEFLRFGFSSTKDQRATIQTWFKGVEELTGMEIQACQALIDELCRANSTSHWQWAGNWVTSWPANMSLTWDLGATSVAWFRPLFSLHAVVSLGQHECTQHERIKSSFSYNKWCPLKSCTGGINCCFWYPLEKGSVNRAVMDQYLN